VNFLCITAVCHICNTREIINNFLLFVTFGPFLVQLVFYLRVSTDFEITKIHADRTEKYVENINHIVGLVCISFNWFTGIYHQ